MTLREKGAWASLIATALVFVPYFRSIFTRFAQGTLNPGDGLGAFIGATIYLTVISIFFGIAVELLSRREPTDERDVAIDAKSYRIAYYVLSASGMTAVVVIVFLSVVPLQSVRDRTLAPEFLGQVLLFCFVLAEAVKSVAQIVCYRRGF
jgi:hypothetical protein